jgi:hypothetical protein
MVADRLIASLLKIAREDLDGSRMLASQGNRDSVLLLGSLSCECGS